METLQKYLQFIANNAREYKKFNKQLIVGELAGFFAGLLVAEVSNATIHGLASGEWVVSILSSIADYAAAIGGFFVVFYYDNKSSFAGLSAWTRLKRIWKTALSLWPSVVAADIVFLLVRPYIQFQLLNSNIDVGITTVLAHFVAFGAFNLVAILSKSVFDFYRYSNSARSTPL
jgi:hypothetical protein